MVKFSESTLQYLTTDIQLMVDVYIKKKTNRVSKENYSFRKF